MSTDKTFANSEELFAHFGTKSWNGLRKAFVRRLKNSVWVLREYIPTHNENFSRKFTVILQLHANDTVTVNDFTKEGVAITVSQVPQPVRHFLCMSGENNTTSIIPRTFRNIAVGVTSRVEALEVIDENRKKVTFKVDVTERVPAKEGIKVGNVDDGTMFLTEDKLFFPFTQEKLDETVAEIQKRVENEAKRREQRRLDDLAAASLAQQRAEQLRRTPVEWVASGWAHQIGGLADTYENERDELMRRMIVSDYMPTYFEPTRLIRNTTA